MLELIYHNDHKEKWQSHEVGIANYGDFGLQELEISRGYGATYEEAFEDFKLKFAKYLDGLTATYNVIDALIPIEVDCCGKEIKAN